MGTFGATANLTAKIWQDEVLIAGQKESFFESNGFISTKPTSIIQKKLDLTKKKGDSIVIPMVPKLSGAGVSGDGALRGNEETVTPYDMTVTVDQLRNGILLAGKMNEQKVAFNMRTTAKDLLKIWHAETRDQMYFTALCADVTSGRQTICSATHTTEATIDANDKMALKYLRKAKRLAKNANPKIKPYKWKGKDWYVVVLHTNQFRDLMDDQDVKDILQNAAPRDYDNNPLFTGANLVLDGMIIYEHENIRVTTTGAASYKVGHGLLLGCQAAVEGVALESLWEEDPTIDYGNQCGFATGFINGVKRSIFNGKEWGVWKVLSACADD